MIYFIKKLRLNLLFFLLFPFLGYSQSSNNNLYFFFQRYSPETIQTLKSNGYSRVDIITNSSIVNSKGLIDYNNITNNLKKIIKEDTELLIIDWEKEDFWNLKQKTNTKKFKVAEERFIDLISFIKKKYPSIKVGVYGLPFKVFYNKKAAYNEPKKYDRILKIVDVITPSLYFDYLDKERGKTDNYLFLKNQLDVSLDYGQRLGKPVLPFIWEIVHTSNKSFGGTLMPQDEFTNKLNYINNYNYKNTKVNGLIWWAPGNATIGHLPTTASSIQNRSSTISNKKMNKNQQYQANKNRNIKTIEYLNYYKKQK